MKTMRCKGFVISERKGGTFKVSYDSSLGFWSAVCDDFHEAGEWVWNMADNHDIGRAVNHRMCDVFGKTFGDPWVCLGY